MAARWATARRVPRAAASATRTAAGRARAPARRTATSCSDRMRLNRQRRERRQAARAARARPAAAMRIGSAVGSAEVRASTQTISPDVRASAARMAAEMRWRSCARKLHHHLPRRCRRRPDEPPPPEKPPPPLLPPPPPIRHRTAATVAARPAGTVSSMREHHQRKPGETISRTRTTIRPGDERTSGRSAAPAAVEPQRGPLLPLRGIRGQNGDDVVDAAGDAAGEIAGLEARRDGVGDDHLGQRVGQRAFEAIADLDAHPPLVGRDQQQHAVVLGLLAELPGAEQLVGIGLDLLAVERGHGGDHELDAGLGSRDRRAWARAPRASRPG